MGLRGEAWLRRLGAAAGLLAGAGAAGADVAFDGSIGPAHGPAPFDGTTWHVTDDRGMRSPNGANLYHSLSLLDVPAGFSASFRLADPASPEPLFVIARVTGHKGSEIDGRIQSLHAGASLFLLNPHGFSFGPESVLQALGSVYVSTADVLRFGHDPAFDFDARSTAKPETLSAEAPTAFGFLEAPHEIAEPDILFDLDTPDSGFDSLPVPRGATLAAVGRKVDIGGWEKKPPASVVPTIVIEGGSLELAAVGAAGVDVPVDVAKLDARALAPGSLGEVSLGRNALVDVGSVAGSPVPVGSGRVVVRGGRIVVDEGAGIQAIAASNVAGDPVAIDLEGSDAVEVGGGALLTVRSAVAAAGEVRFSAPTVHLKDGAFVRARSTQRVGDSGSRISVVADSARVDTGAVVQSTSERGAPGGAIAFEVGELRVEGGGIVSENTGTAAGGAIGVDASREVRVTERGKIFSQATGAASGPGGDVRVTAGARILVVGEDSTEADASQISALTSSKSPGGAAGRLEVSAPTIELRDAGQLRTTTTGAGRGGALDVVDTDLLLVVGNAAIDAEKTGAGLFARTTASDAPGAPAGAGGSISIGARVLQVEDGGEISARTLGDGDAGDLVIAGAERVAVIGGPRGVSTLSAKAAAGAGGDLVIETAELELASGGEVSASTVGTGDAGDVHVSADRIVITGAPSGLFSQTVFAAAASGDAGNVDVAFTESLEVRDGGRISVDSRGGGAAGGVSIRGGPGASIALVGVGGEVSAKSRRSAEAGSIAISTGVDFVAGRGASVVTEAEENASGGQIEITAGRTVYLSDAQILTRVDVGGPGANGDGGDVFVPRDPTAASRLAVLNRSAIVASALDGNGGNIDVTAGDLLASQGVVIDPTSKRGGVSGEVRITSPDATLAGQITPLPSNYIDASKLLTTACDARRSRRGSFVVQTRAASPPLPDAPLAPSDLHPGNDDAADDEQCPG